MSYTVYKHTSPKGKVYIGITKQKPVIRWNSGFGYVHNEYFFRAIKKYGWDNFKHEILFEGLTKEQAEQKEIELIKRFNSTNREFGYNIKAGGDTCEASEETKRKMSIALKGKSKGRFVGSKSVRAKEIKMYSLEGEYIKTFGSSTDAERETGIDYASIIKCCCKKRKSAGGYLWSYSNNIPAEYKRLKKSTAVNQYSLDGVFIKQWDCIQDANNALGITKGLISKACVGHIKQTGGYRWSYVHT